MRRLASSGSKLLRGKLGEMRWKRKVFRAPPRKVRTTCLIATALARRPSGMGRTALGRKAGNFSLDPLVRLGSCSQRLV